MRELRSDIVSNRRVRLLVNQAGRYTVTIEVIGPDGAWEDISMVADAIWICTPPASVIGCA